MKEIMILTAPEYDPGGMARLYLRYDSFYPFFGGGRRMTKSITLDGGISVYDRGYSRLDREWRVTLTRTPGIEAMIDYLAATYNRVLASTTAGLYYVVVREWEMSGVDLMLNLVLVGKVD